MSKAGISTTDGNVLTANHPGPLLHVTLHHLFSFLCHPLALLSNKVNNNASKFIEIWKLNNNFEKLRHWTRMTEDNPQSVLRTVRWWKIYLDVIIQKRLCISLVRRSELKLTALMSISLCAVVSYILVERIGCASKGSH